MKSVFAAYSLLALTLVLVTQCISGSAVAVVSTQTCQDLQDQLDQLNADKLEAQADLDDVQFNKNVALIHKAGAETARDREEAYVTAMNAGTLDYETTIPSGQQNQNLINEWNDLVDQAELDIIDLEDDIDQIDLDIPGYDSLILSIQEDIDDIDDAIDANLAAQAAMNCGC